MTNTAHEFRAWNEITAADVERVKAGELTLTVLTKRGATKGVYRRLRRDWYRDESGEWAKREWYALEMSDGSKCGPLSNELAAIFTPEVAEARKAKADARRKERAGKAASVAASVKVGDVFYASWGYDQTNVDYFQVTAKSGQFVTIRGIGCASMESDRYTEDKITADPGHFLAWSPFIHDNSKGRKIKIQSYDGKRPYLSLESFANAYPWDGEPDYRTNSYFGH
jgi:hypothetical protein